jgi:CRISPR system Cascade subunit CasD
LAATGKVKLNASTKEPETVVSWRDYLCDGAFLVAVRGEEDLTARCAYALQRPVWPPYLGRKSCPPTRPLYEGVGNYDSVEQALSRWPRLPGVGSAPDEPLLAELPALYGQGRRRPDEILSRTRRVYGLRAVRQVLLYPPDPQQEDSCTSPN